MAKRNVDDDVKILTKFVVGLTDESSNLHGQINPDVVHAMDNIVHNSNSCDRSKGEFWAAVANYNSHRVAIAGTKKKKHVDSAGSSN